MTKKTAIILFNLGGPDSLQAVRPFLFNLFNDKAIIRLPAPLRQCVAWMISSRREKTAQAIYNKIGGRSPILPNTEQQARALETFLNDPKHNTGADHYRCFIAMRYWHPLTDETAEQVKAYQPDDIVLLPLYPQFSTTTTASSLAAWRQAAVRLGLTAPTRSLCCYPTETGFITALAGKTRQAYAEAQKKNQGKPRVLFTAHGLPEKIVKAGDPYQTQCEMTVAALLKELAIDDLDYTLCYQSRVGPLQWIRPATDSEIERAGHDKVPLVIVPIAFVSEHSETLVELDIEYRELAKESGVPHYTYVPTVSVLPDFIAGLGRLVQQAPAAISSGTGKRLCDKGFSGCPCQQTDR